MRDKKRISRFATVGALNTVVDFTVFNALYYILGMPVLIANTIAYSFGILNSFVFNKYWTFSDRNSSSRPLRQLTLFVLLNLVGLMLSNIVVASLTLWIPAVLAKLIAISVTLVWNFWTSHRLVFVLR